MGSSSPFVCPDYQLVSPYPLHSTHLLVNNGVACTGPLIVAIECVVIWVGGRVFDFQVPSIAGDRVRVAIFRYSGALRQHPLEHLTCTAQ